MANRTERPGVYSSYTVTSSLRGKSGAAVGLVAAAEGAAEKGKVYPIAEYDAAAAAFGAGSSMAKLCRVLLQNGAASICCVPLEKGAPTADYRAAFAVLGREAVELLVCDGQDKEIYEAMLQSIQQTDEQYKYRVGVVDNGESVGELAGLAKFLNHERMILVGPGTELPGAAAAAVCGVLAGQTDPAIPQNGAEVQGLDALRYALTDGEVEHLLANGVTPLEQLGAAIQIVRGVTTRTETNGVEDSTWHSVSTVRIVDYVLPWIRDALRVRFGRSKNTKQTRGAIRTQVTVMLEEMVQKEIIDAYENVNAAADPEDPGCCLVQFDFAVTHGLDQIYLQANITV